MLKNQRFLLKMVGEFHARHPSMEFDDLVSEANLGLMRAAEKFDPSTGNRFLTYARFWILQSLGRFHDQWSLPVRLPDNRARELKRLREAKQETGSTDPKVLSEATGVERETVELLLPHLGGVISLDAPVRNSDGEDGESFGELLLPVTVDYLGLVQASELWDVLMKLPERQRDILMHRYGAFGSRKMTLQEIADSYGITRERVRQIEAQALNMCRRLGRRIA